MSKRIEVSTIIYKPIEVVWDEVKIMKNLIINCKTNLSFGEIRIFLSEKRPIKKIETNKKFNIKL